MNYSKLMKPNYKRRLLLFIVSVFMFGFLIGVKLALLCSAVNSELRKIFLSKEVQETILTYHEPIQAKTNNFK